jgi:hypothetical protein
LFLAAFSSLKHAQKDRTRACLLGFFNRLLGVNNVAQPTLTLAGPSVGQKVTGTTVVFRGKAIDDSRVDRVEVAISGGAPQVVQNTGTSGDFLWILSTLPENGVNTAVVTAFDEFNRPSSQITRKFTFAHVRPEFAGIYTGLAMPTVDSTNPARQVGLSKVTVGPTGVVSGKLTLGGSPVPFVLSAIFGNGGNARFRVNGAATSALEIKRTGLPPLFLALNLDVSAPLDHQITGTLTENGTVVSTFELNRALYMAGKNPAGSPLRHVPATVLNPLTDRGAYTCIFQAIAPPNDGLPAERFPQGDGWALSKVKASGAVTVAGKLGDGQPFSYANYLSKDNVLPFFLRPYAGTGTVSGPVSFRDVPGQSDADGVGLRWFKPANPKDKLYPIGWPAGIKVDLLGSKFIVPAKPTRTNPNPLYLLGRDHILGLPGVQTPTGVMVVLADGDITPIAGISKAATVDGMNRVIITGPVDALNLEATLTASNGRLGGSFKHPGSNKTVTFGGVVFQKLHTAGGYFLYYPPKPAGQPAPSGLSGSVGLAP